MGYYASHSTMIKCKKGIKMLENTTAEMQAGRGARGFTTGSVHQSTRPENTQRNKVWRRIYAVGGSKKKRQYSTALPPV